MRYMLVGLYVFCLSYFAFVFAKLILKLESNLSRAASDIGAKHLIRLNVIIASVHARRYLQGGAACVS